eukprot:g8944.t1 g8944   contig34:483074-483643(-)
MRRTTLIATLWLNLQFVASSARSVAVGFHRFGLGAINSSPSTPLEPSAHQPTPPSSKGHLQFTSANNLRILSLRGGDIIPISSLSQVESIIHQSSDRNILVVLDFTAKDCPPCKMIAPIYTDMSDLEEFTEKGVVFLKVNVNDNPDVAKRYGVDGWPTFVLFKNGKKVGEIVGGQAAKAGLYSLVAKHA